MTEDTFFSVIIPLYNKESSIKNTVQSVLEQAYKNFELVVINDGSTDCSAEIVKSFNDNRVRLIHQANQGVSVARNRGIKESKYNWLALLDGDDEWDESYLEKMNQAISADPACVAYCTKFKKQSLGGANVKISWKYVPVQQGRLDNYYKACFFSSPIITSSSVCLNKKNLNLKGGDGLFPIGVKSGEDLDTWVRLARHNSIYVINEELVTIIEVSAGTAHLKSRSSGEFDYKKWFFYQCGSKEKGFWLKLYAIKKLYESLKKKMVVNAPWLYQLYRRIK